MKTTLKNKNRTKQKQKIIHAMTKWSNSRFRGKHPHDLIWFKIILLDRMGHFFLYILMSLIKIFIFIFLDECM